MKVPLLAIVLLTGCTAANLPSEPQATGTPPIRAAVKTPHPALHPTQHVVQHPLNCGTPDEYKICPLPVRQVIVSQELDDLTPVPQGHVMVEELPGGIPTVPEPPGLMQTSAPPIPDPPQAPPSILLPPAPTVLSQSLTRLQDDP